MKSDLSKILHIIVGLLLIGAQSSYARKVENGCFVMPDTPQLFLTDIFNSLFNKIFLNNICNLRMSNLIIF